MPLVSDLNNVPPDFCGCGLTIGSFDGVHLGHQALLATLKKQIAPDAPIAVFSFPITPLTSSAPIAPFPSSAPLSTKPISLVPMVQTLSF